MFESSSPTLRRLHHWLAPIVAGGTVTVARFQQVCGVTSDFTNSHTPPSPDGSPSHSPIRTIRFPLLYYFFMTAAAAGNELFYIVALPSLFWLVNVDLARRMIITWGIIYYVGQSAKDLLKLPRPQSPPVTRLESHYETEYGFPSTHAMVSFTLPLYALFCLERIGIEPNWTIGFICCFLWCASITLSRLYVGVHSPCDLVGGLLLGLLVLGIGLTIGEPVDAFLISHPLAPAVAILVSIFTIWSYPSPAAWTNAYGDTALIIAVVAGVCCGQCVYFNREPALSYHIQGETFTQQFQSACGIFILIVLRLVIGCGQYQ